MKKLEQIIKDFFKKLEIKIDNIEMSEQENDIFLIKLKTEESGIIIGPHGRNLNNFQNIIKLLLTRELDKKIRIHLEVNDYLKSKDERLFSFVDSKINFVIKSGKDIRLPFLTAYERKKVHSFISEKNNDTISTKSIGEGKERRLFICKKSPKLSIDIDGADI